MYIQITLSDDAVRNHFIESGKMIAYDECEVLYDFAPESLTEEDRELIIDCCKYDGKSTFIFDSALMDSYNFDINDVLTLIRNYNNSKKG